MCRKFQESDSGSPTSMTASAMVNVATASFRADVLELCVSTALDSSASGLGWLPALSVGHLLSWLGARAQQVMSTQITSHLSSALQAVQPSFDEAPVRFFGLVSAAQVLTVHARQTFQLGNFFQVMASRLVVVLMASVEAHSSSSSLDQDPVLLLIKHQLPSLLELLCLQVITVRIH